MKTKTKKKDIKDLQYPCYFTAIPKLKEGTDIVETIEAQNQSLMENNRYFKKIQKHNYEFIQDLMLKTDADVSTEDFFRFIRYDPAVLGSRLAQDKILRWQNEIFNNDGTTSFKAEYNLKRIGIELALKGSHSPNVTLKVAFYKDFFGELFKTFTETQRDEFLQIIEDNTNIIIREDKDIANLYVDIDCDKKNLPRLIDLMVAKMMNITEGTVEQYLKQVFDVYDNKQKIGFAIELKAKAKTKKPRN